MSSAQARPSSPAGVRRLGRYALRYRIAQGGMASVYLAQFKTPTNFEKWVAIKVIHPHIATSPRFVAMFLDEARLAAMLNHPNLCQVFECGEFNGTYYLAMEYLHGETLGVVARRSWARNIPMPLVLAARLVADAARGLHAAHELRLDDGEYAHVVHRDVSPENIFVTYTGIAKVVDFGVARSKAQTQERTATGELKGKVAYMSPEQVHETPLDRRTDVWALGVVLWEITTGRRLFRRKSDAATVFAVLRDPVPKPERFRPGFPEELERVIARALERDPSQRYQSALEMARALEVFLSHAGGVAGAGEVSEYMESLFADEIVFREQLLRSVHDDAPVENVTQLWQTGNQGAVIEALRAQKAAAAAQDELPEDEPTAHLRSPTRPPVTPRVNDSGAPIPLTREALPEPVEAEVVDAEAVDDEGVEAANDEAQADAAPEDDDAIEDAALDAVLPDDSRDITTPRVPQALPELPSVPVRASLPPAEVPRWRRRGGLSVVFALMLTVLGAATLWMLTNRAPLPSPTPSPVRVRTPSPVRNDPPPPEAVRTPSVVAPSVVIAPSVVVAPSVAAPRDRVPVRRAPVAPQTQQAPAPSTQPAATPHDEAPGYLSFSSTPAAEVFEGDRSLGETPITDRSFTPGAHDFRFVPTNGFTPRAVHVEVRPGASALVQMRFQEATPTPAQTP